MTRAIAVASAVGLLLAGVPAASDAQTTTVTGFDADVEGGPVSGLALSMAPHAQMVLRGEAFESLDRGLGASVALSAYFAERYLLRGRVGATRNGEGSSLYDDRTTTLDVWLEMRWVRSVFGFQIEGGPTVGYARMSRPMYLGPINGFLAGVGVGAVRPLLKGFGVVLGVDATWSSFTAPPVALAAPPGWDNDADGNRVSLSLGLAHRWTRP